MKWRDDPQFVRWLIAHDYAQVVKGKVQPLLTNGQILYMQSVCICAISDIPPLISIECF